MLARLSPITASDRKKDRKSTRLNSSHSQISYAVFCLKKKKKLCVLLNTCLHPTTYRPPHSLTQYLGPFLSAQLDAHYLLTVDHITMLPLTVYSTLCVW